MENKREVVLDILSKISDLDFQQEVWVHQKYWDYVLNFGEAVNTLDDYSFFDEVRNERFMSYPEAQAEASSFARNILNYDEPIDPASMQRDPNWLKIAEQAGKLCDWLSKHENW